MFLASNGNSEKKSEPQMGFEPTNLRDLVGCTSHRGTRYPKFPLFSSPSYLIGNKEIAGKGLTLQTILPTAKISHSPRFLEV